MDFSKSPNQPVVPHDVLCEHFYRIQTLLELAGVEERSQQPPTHSSPRHVENRQKRTLAVALHCFDQLQVFDGGVVEFQIVPGFEEPQCGDLAQLRELGLTDVMTESTGRRYGEGVVFATETCQRGYTEMLQEEPKSIICIECPTVERTRDLLARPVPGSFSLSGLLP